MISPVLQQVTLRSRPPEISPSQTSAQGGSLFLGYEGNGGTCHGMAIWDPPASFSLGAKQSPAFLMTFWFPTLFLQLWGRGEKGRWLGIRTAINKLKYSDPQGVHGNFLMAHKRSFKRINFQILDWHVYSVGSSFPHTLLQMLFSHFLKERLISWDSSRKQMEHLYWLI